MKTILQVWYHITSAREYCLVTPCRYLLEICPTTLNTYIETKVKVPPRVGDVGSKISLNKGLRGLELDHCSTKSKFLITNTNPDQK